jgi:hypothetical protein
MPRINSHPRPRRLLAALSGFALTAAGAVLATSLAPEPAGAANGVPRPDHVVIVVFENTAQTSIIGNSQAPYFNQLATTGANFTNSFAIEHPSEPNYLDLFSGSNQGVTDDSCPHTFSTPNEGAQLIAAGLTFTGYSEDLPSAGSTVCTSGLYARKHNPWVNFSNVPATANQPFSAFPTDFTQLPTVSWVVPNLCDDIHDCSIATGDAWLKAHLDSYVQWAKTRNSVLITTFDEDDSSHSNHIATIFNGQPVKTGTYAEHIDHYNVLRTVEDMYGLPYAGNATTATPITDAWTTTPAPVSVTNPGNQTGTVGTPISNLTLSATGGTPPYTWSATGLPAGLTISTSGVISGTPTTGGTYSVTATATDLANSPGSTSFTWTVQPAGGCTGQQLANPGFESGPIGWTATTGVIGQNGLAEPARTGTWDAWLDGNGTSTTDTLSQSFSIPAGCRASLSFYRHIDTAETTTTKRNDRLTVTLGSTTVAGYSNLDAASGYQQATFDVSSFAGQTLTLTYTGVENRSRQTSFVIDDTSVTLS